MKINTGRGTIPLITLVGIWSVSALTSLPGLAVSPILGQLTTIFPHATELDIQMLTSLPSLLIIPFVLLAGKLAEKLGIPPANLSILKTGKAKAVRMSTMDAICRELQCQPGDLFEFVQDGDPWKR